MELLAGAFIYLVSAVIAVPLAHRLGLGSVLGYLIAGIVIGPAFGLVGAETEEVMHFAEFGVVMMLFLVGLELQPFMLWRMRAQLLGLGGLQVVATAVLLALAALLIGLTWQASVAVGMILALSSTAIVLQTLNEKGWMKAPAGRSAFSVLLFQDIAVIPMLALLPLLAIGDPTPAHLGDHGHASGIAHWPEWVQAIAILSVIAGIIAAGRFLIRPVFRFVAEARLREVFTAAALLLVVGIALAMDAIGLSPALGTFLAGVVLSDSEYRHELESDIAPFKGLLLGLFFISVGAGIDFGLLFGQPLQIFGLVLAVMAIKLTVLLALGRAFGLPGSDTWLFGLGLAQAGEFAFVLFGVALTGGVIVLAEAQMLTVIVTVSMLATPLLFIVYERVIAPRAAVGVTRDADTIEEWGPVVIAGVGRFGQIVSRFLIANGQKVIVLDHDPALIEMLRKFGLKTYYGDATRPDLLHAAGLEQARIFVAALDDAEAQTRLVAHVARTYPCVHIIARAHNRQHVYELLEAGAHEVEREMFESALCAGRQALVALGAHPFRAHQLARAFRRHDLQSLEMLHEAWSNGGFDQHYVAAARMRYEELVRLMGSDRSDRHDTSDRGWTPPPKGDAAS